MKQYIIYLILMASVCGCCIGEHDGYSYVPKDRKLIYRTGDKLIYKSNYGNFDTIIFLDYMKHYPSLDKNTRCETYYYHEYLGFYFDHTKHIPENGSLVISQNNSGQNTLRWLNGYNYTFRSDDKYSYIRYKLTNGKEYFNVYQQVEPSSIDNNKFSADGCITVIILYNCTEGLLSYELDNGEIWKLYEVIKH